MALCGCWKEKEVEKGGYEGGAVGFSKGANGKEQT